MHLIKRGTVAGQIFDDSEAHDSIEEIVGEGDLLDIGDLVAILVVIGAGILDHACRQVSAPCVIAAARKLGGKVTGAATDVKNSRTPGQIGFDHLNGEAPAGNEILGSQSRRGWVVVIPGPVVDGLGKQVIYLRF